MKTAWTLTCQRAKIVGLHFHDLRRVADLPAKGRIGAAGATALLWIG